MTKRLEDKVVIVTGGNSGIGRGIVEQAIKEGARLSIAGRDVERGEQTLRHARSLGADAEFFAGDLSVEAEAKALVENTLKRFGRLDVLVNNAGVGARRSGVLPDDPPGERLRKVLGPTLHAAYYMSAYAMPALRDAGNGAIVNISSTGSQHGNWGSYGIAKAGIEALTRSLAYEGAPYGIRANALSPGWIETESSRSAAPKGGWAKDASLFGRMGTLEEMAQTVIFFASAESSFVTGMTLIVDGGFTIVDYPARQWLDAAGGAVLFPGLLARESAP